MGQWMGRFSPQEYAVLWFIFFRTIGWSKTWERVTLDQLEQGVWSGEKCIQPGTGISRATLVKSLSNLTGDKYRDEDGNAPLIRRYEAGRKVFYAIEFKCMIPIPKRLQAVKDSSDSKLHRFRNYTDDSLTSKLDTVQKLNSKKDKEEGQRKRTNDNSEAEDSTSQKLERIKLRHIQKRESKALGALKPGSNLPDFNALWKATVAREFPKAPIWDWSAKERGMVSTLRKKWEESGNTRSTFGVFLQWCVEKWGPMMHYAFPSSSIRKMKAPAVPDLRFIVSRARLFAEHYQSAHIEAMQKENSAENIASRERKLARLKTATEEQQAKTKKAMENLAVIRKRLNMARHGLDTPRKNSTAKELGIKVKVANCPDILTRYDG